MRRRAGISLLEIMVTTGLLSIVLAITLSAVRDGSEALAQQENHDHTFKAAALAQTRIRDELSSVVADPTFRADSATTFVRPRYGFAAPACYHATPHAMPVFNQDWATSFTWRPVVGFISPNDPGYADASAAGLVSTNNILYAPFAKRIYWDPVNKSVKLQVLRVTVTGNPNEPPVVADALDAQASTIVTTPRLPRVVDTLRGFDQPFRTRQELSGAARTILTTGFPREVLLAGTDKATRDRKPDLAEDVVAFGFFDASAPKTGAFTAFINTPPGNTDPNETLAVGFFLEVERRSALLRDQEKRWKSGASATPAVKASSNLKKAGPVPLRYEGAVTIMSETITNTKSRPAVGP